MKRSPSAPPYAKKPACAPSPDRALPGGSRPDDAPGSPPALSFPSAFDWTDAADARAWLHAVRGAADDLAILADEGARRLRYHVFSRAERRRQAREAHRSILGLLAEAEAGLAAGHERQENAPKH